MRFRPGLPFAVFTAGQLLACNADDAEPRSRGAAELRYRELDQSSELVFESIYLHEGDDVEVISLIGDISSEQWQRIARPWSYRSDEWVYNEESWEEYDADGNVVRGYRATRSPNLEPQSPPEEAVTPSVDPILMEKIEAQEAEIMVTIIPIGVPEWTIPLLPPAFAVPHADYAQLIADRAAALEERKESFRSVILPVLELATQAGGKIVGIDEIGGTVTLLISSGLALQLSEDDSISSVVYEGQSPQIGAWDLGDGRQSVRVDAQQFLDAGYNGTYNNATRHGYGGLTVAIIEPGMYEDEACFFADGANCAASRIASRFRCNNASPNLCQSTTNFPDTDSNSGHGTTVASAAIGDYGDNQHIASGTCPSGGCPTGSVCENTRCTFVPGVPTNPEEASSFAPEAAVLLFGDMIAGTESAAYAEAISDATSLHVDVMSLSWGAGASCAPVAGTASEKASEIAFDDGVLVVACAGNDNATLPNTCNAWAPAGIPKTLAVSSFDAKVGACQLDFRDDCVYGPPEGSARGGADAHACGTNYTGALALVDMLGPNNVRFLTNPTGDYGTINGAEYPGCSFATPQVAGMAIEAKDWYLNAGLSWINSPGRLQTLMLAMTDRHRGASAPTTQMTTGLDNYAGLGKSKLRLINASVAPAGNNMLTWSFSSAANKVYFPFGPIPAGVDLVKCVMMQVETLSRPNDDVGGLASISDVNLEIRIKPKNANNLCSSLETASFTRSDTSADTRKMVAVESSQVSGGFTNKCIEVTLNPACRKETVTTHTMCYYSSLEDDESL